MIDYRKGKERYSPDQLGSLYVDKSKLEEGERPIIYIGGQMEHRLHILEQSGKTFDSGHNMYSGSWFYDYPILGFNKSEINATNMCSNLLNALKMANLEDVDLVTESFGGLIGAYASKDSRIHKIFAIHPPITGTPLANPEELKKYRELFTKREHLVRLIIERLVNKSYGFEQDSFKGVDLNNVDLNKLVVIGSSLDLNTEKNRISKICYDIIMKSTGRPSDGVVVYDEELFKKLGINYLREAQGLNHFDAGSEDNLNRVSRLIKDENTERITQLMQLNLTITNLLEAIEKRDETAKQSAIKKILAITIDENDDLAYPFLQLTVASNAFDESSIIYWGRIIMDLIDIELSAFQAEKGKNYVIRPLK